MVQAAASLVGLLKGNLQIFLLSRDFVTALLTLLFQKIEVRIQIICGQFLLLTLTIFLGGERTDRNFSSLIVFRDEKGCSITQETGGVQIIEWVRVLLGATFEVPGVVGSLGILTLLVCFLSTGCHQGILPCSSPLT